MFAAAVAPAPAAQPPTPHMITFVRAGNGGQSAVPVDGVATQVPLGEITALAAMGSGEALIAMRSGYGDDARGWVSRVDRNGRLKRVAGTVLRCTEAEGAPARSACLPPEVTALAALPGGGFLIGYAGRIRAVGTDLRIRTIAGSGFLGFSGDGGPAATADLSTVRDLLPLPGGSLLLADGARVRLVDPAGIIRTVAGSGRTGSRPPSDHLAEPAPARTVALDGPRLDLLPGGAVLVAGGPAPLAVLGDDGVLRPRTRFPVDFDDVAVTSDGLVYVTNRWSVQRVRERGLSPLADGDGAVRDGEPARRVELRDITALTGSGGRGVLVAQEERVLLLAPLPSRPLAAALRPDEGDASTGYAARVVLTRRARVRLSLLHGDAVVARARRTVDAGLGVVRVRRRLRPGRYTVHLQVRAAGQTVSRNTEVVLGDVVPVSVAREIAVWLGSGDDEPDWVPAGCRRFGPRRVDCRMVAAGERRCRVAMSAQLRSSGLVDVGLYSCAHARRLRPRPTWTRVPRPFALERVRGGSR